MKFCECIERFLQVEILEVLPPHRLSDRKSQQGHPRPKLKNILGIYRGSFPVP